MSAIPELEDLAWIPLGRLLTRAGLVTAEQLEQALLVKETTGRRLGEIVVELGFATERAIAVALAEQYGLEFVDLDVQPIDQQVVELLPESLARRYEALPLGFLPDDVLLLGVTDPTNLRTADDLRMALGVPFRLAVVDPSQLGLATARAYRSPFSQLAVVESTSVGDQTPDMEDIRDLASSKPTINLVNSLLTTAIEEGASDIHFEPQRHRLLVRVRVDGVMRELATVPKHMQAAVTSRLKIMAALDIAERRAPQDGRVSAHFGGKPIDLRVAALHTTHGEQIVLRILNQQRGLSSLADLGMSSETEDIFRHAISQPYGAVIVCGPTGSGKTTTLYAALDHLNTPDRVLMTIEDPVEHQMEGVNQIETDSRASLTFALGLRTILRSDPDVLLVGEVRDEETAGIAIQAAMTGHLVLTSLHAHNAAGAVNRLREMGVQPGLLASSLNCIVAQRLARRLCDDCKQSYVGSTAELGGNGTAELYRAVGCPRCGGSGYSGRVALREVMPIAGEVRGLIEASTENIFAAAVRQGMTTLREDGLRLCLAGICSVDEVRRVTGARLV
jgi:type IV pilus assembly protein PilB